MRNSVCLAFFMLNALWIAVIFMVQAQQDKLIPIQIAYQINGNNITIEPLGKLHML